MNHSDQSTENEADGDNSGTVLQAGTIGGDVYVGASAPPRRRRIRWYLCIPAVAVVAGAGVAVKLALPDEPVRETSVAATVATATESGTTSSSASSAPATSTAAAAARPAPASPTPRPPVGAPTTVPPTPTTTFDLAAAPPPPPPAGVGVRFNGTLTFGSYNLDLLQPRRMDGYNVWPLLAGRLHGDEGYWLAEWAGDGVPGRSECDSVLTQRATRDAENLVAGSRVCGKTPESRIFLVEVVAVDGTTINGQVTVWG